MVDQRLQEIAENLESVRARITSAAKSSGRNSDEITLIVVTKTYPVEDIQRLHSLGQRHFGENRILEGAEKAAMRLPDATWHFQGQIQSNKIKDLVSWADVIHSLDDLRHAEKINERVDVKKVLIQVSLDGELHRGGVAPDRIHELAEEIMGMSHLELKGLMAVAPLEEEPDMAFSRLATIYQRFIRDFPQCNWLSAGMSNDFESAISHGATHVRVGSSILGKRS
ncbi:MAG: YggS family pyridoxal phosphate-dependent enzyme [Actinobacteria bacterium]|jgi:pyridoxal phosphate enzyme (YggS family)|nr:YggS family pyridoxal phosphate-dependent enzyme [Actinomycetota bacterium]